MSDITSFKVVVAIDFGTSRSGYAYAFTDDRKVIYRDLWPGQRVAYVKTLTHLLYSPALEVDSWGFEAPSNYAKLRRGRKSKDYYYFRRFKMWLREEKNRGKDGPYITNNNREFLALDLIADYLRLIKELALSEIRESTAGLLVEDQIFWCLTVPAIWTDAEKHLMRRAAQKAGLIGEGDAEAERLLLVLEPEAAAIYCQQWDKSTLKPRDCFMVVDCGGGTVDITVHEVLAGKGLKEVVPGTGGPHGSMFVDRSFREYLIDKLTVEVLEHFHNEYPVEYLNLMIEDWERTKCGFDPRTSGEIIEFPIRPRLYNVLQKRAPEMLDKLADEQEGEDAYLLLTSEQMHSFFCPALDGLVEKVEEQFQRLGTQQCDYIYLVGGFSTSPVLQQRIRQEFESRVTKIVMPPTPGAAIMAGAVYFGLDPEVIRARRTRLTYGADGVLRFRDGIDPESKRSWFSAENIYLCQDRFITFVRAGDSVETNQKVTRVYHTTENNERFMTFKFFATSKKDVEYVDEQGVVEIGELTIERNETTDGLNWQVELTMYFGKTEIKVEAVDRKSGQKCNTRLRFSSTLSPELIGNENG